MRPIYILQIWTLLGIFSIGHARAQRKTISLSHSLNLARQNNPTLKIDQYRIPLAESDLLKSKIYQNPIFNVQYLQLLPSSSLYTKDKGPLHPTNSQDWFQLTKRFQVFGQRKNRIELARYNYIITQNEVKETERDVLHIVALKWIDAWYSTQYRRISIAAADYLDQLMVQRKVDLYSENSPQHFKLDERLRFQILDDQYDLRKANAEQAYTNEVLNLQYLSGITDSINIDITDTLEPVRITENTDSLLVIAHTYRQELINLPIQAQYATTNASYQSSLRLPQPEAGVVWNPQNTIPYLGVYFTQMLPIFDRNQADVQRAKVLVRQAQTESEKTVMEVRTEIDKALRTYQSRRDALQRFRHNLSDSERLLKLVSEEYVQGKLPKVDLWEAEETWFDTQALYYQCWMEYRKAYIEVLYQTGLITLL